MHRDVPALFATTEEFMRRFGIGTLSDLPNMDPEQEDEIRTAVEEELKFKLEELGSSNATEEAPGTVGSCCNKGTGAGKRIGGLP